MAAPQSMESAWVDIEISDVEEVVRDVDPGAYTSQSLYEVYCEVAQKHGRLSASQKAFGIAMKSLGNVPVRNGSGRGWLIPERD